ncbi:hypothetical protein [Saccharopolyspora taberi]|uniref:hypothetical protein n=1 Tax=Saccharopolyspora taberi TaxID=60895 RepID=UPI0031E17A7F
MPSLLRGAGRFDHVAARLGDACGELEAVLGNGELLAGLRIAARPPEFDLLIREIDGLSSVQALGLSYEVVEPGPSGVRELVRAVDQLTAISALGMPEALFSGIPEKFVRSWSERAARSHAGELGRLPREVRVTLLAALCVVRRRELVDVVADVLVGLVHHLRARIEQRLRRDPPELDGLGRDALLRLLEAALDRPDSPVRSVLYPIVDEDSMRSVVEEAREVEPSKRAVLRSVYSPYYQQVLALLLGTLEFRCLSTRRWPLMAALGELAGDYTSTWGTPRRYEPDLLVPVDGIVPAAWRDAVIDRSARVDRVLYGLCVLTSLHDALGSKEICVAEADRWGPSAGELVRIASGGTADDVIAWPGGPA